MAKSEFYKTLINTLPHQNGKGNYKGVAELIEDMRNQLGEFQPEYWEELHNIKVGLTELVKMTEKEMDIRQNQDKNN